MKSKFHSIISVLKYLLNGEQFRLTYFLTVLLAIYGVIAVGQNISSIQETLIIMFQFPFFNIFLQFIILMNTINVCSTFSNEFSFYYIRKEKKKNATIDLIILSVLYNLLFFFVLFLIMFSLCIIFKGITFNSNLYYQYSITYNTYMIFYLIRYVLITLFFTALNTILYQKFNKKILFLNVIFIIMLIAYPASLDGIVIINVLPWNYFTLSNYITFGNELISSLMFILLLIFINILSFKFVYGVRRK